MTSGNFAVVFKMKDEQSGKLYAVKCFTKEQEGRSEAYQEIAKELKDVSSPYLVSIRYLEKELFVDTDQTTETEFPVLLMDWVEGITLDRFIRCNKKDKHKLELLSYKFYKLSMWLISQPFAHGDLKPDNIIIHDSGELILVDYDGMFVPAMNGQNARELGSQDFRSPHRNQKDFDCHIDDFSIVSILLSLCMIHNNPKCLDKYGAQDRLVFSAQDYQNIRHSKAYHAIDHLITSRTNYKLLLQIACEQEDFSLSGDKYKLTRLRKPTKNVRAIPAPKTIDVKANVDIFEKDPNLNQIRYSDSPLEIGVRKIVVPQIDNYMVSNEQSRQRMESGRTLSKKNLKFLDYLKSKNSTKWQSAMLLHILTVFLAI
jgi:serine/threonine protein kinase